MPISEWGDQGLWGWTQASLLFKRIPGDSLMHQTLQSTGLNKLHFLVFLQKVSIDWPNLFPPQMNDAEFLPGGDMLYHSALSHAGNHISWQRRKISWCFSRTPFLFILESRPLASEGNLACRNHGILFIRNRDQDVLYHLFCKMHSFKKACFFARSVSFSGNPCTWGSAQTLMSIHELLSVTHKVPCELSSPWEAALSIKSPYFPWDYPIQGGIIDLIWPSYLCRCLWSVNVVGVLITKNICQYLFKKYNV